MARGERLAVFWGKDVWVLDSFSELHRYTEFGLLA